MHKIKVINPKNKTIIKTISSAHSFNSFQVNTDFIINNWDKDIELYYNDVLSYTFKASERPKLKTQSKTINKDMKTFKTSDNIEYKIDEIGIITQLNPQKFDYSESYINTYNTAEYKNNSIKLNLIRLSLMIGQFGSTPLNILDYGYGNGAFLEQAKEHIKSCDGYDVSPVKVPDGCNRVQTLNGNYDCISFFDSLEHIKDISFIKFLKTKSILISLPYCKNINEFDTMDLFIKWFDTWKHRKPNEHIHHFTPESLELFFQLMGYRMGLICNMEDEIRKPEKEKTKNILTGFFWKY